MVVATFASRWSIFCQQNQFLISLTNSDSNFLLSNMDSSILDILINFLP